MPPGSVIAFCSLKHGTSIRPQELFPSLMPDPGGKKENLSHRQLE